MYIKLKKGQCALLSVLMPCLLSTSRLLIVRLEDILIYLVGGDPCLARMLLRWLKCAERDDMLMLLYVFENIDLLLENHGSDGALIEINARN